MTPQRFGGGGGGGGGGGFMPAPLGANFRMRTRIVLLLTRELLRVIPQLN